MGRLYNVIKRISRPLQLRYNCHQVLCATWLIFVAGSLAKGGHADHSYYTQSRGHKESPDWGDSQRTQDLVSSHKRSEGVRQGLVYVSNQHRPHEESDMLFGRRR